MPLPPQIMPWTTCRSFQLCGFQKKDKKVGDAVADDAVNGRFVEGDGGDSCSNEGGVVEVCLLTFLLVRLIIS